MRIKKAGGKVFGASLTNAEQKAMDMEIQRECAEFDRKNANEIDAMILWSLHAQYGFGIKRLKRFFDHFSTEYENLIKRYEMEDSDGIWLCTQKLKEIGVDVEKWNNERSSK